MSDAKLIGCDACEKEIAVSAKSCPHCGAANNALHPQLKKLKEKIDKNELDIESYRYFLSYDSIRFTHIHNDDGPIKNTWCLLKAFIGAIALAAFIDFATPYALTNKTFDLASAAIVKISLLGLAWWSIRGAWGFFQLVFMSNDVKELKCEVKILEGKVVVSSNDDTFWREIIKIFPSVEEKNVS